MAESQTLITRTPEEDERYARKAAEKALEEAGIDAMQHKMRIESGTCYARDLAWLWDLSASRIRDRLRESDVEPVSTKGKSKLWDVEEANEALKQG